jgi:CoA-transferase family III
MTSESDTRGDVAHLAGLVTGAANQRLAIDDHIRVVGPDVVAASAYDVDRILASSAVYAVAAADGLGLDRGAQPSPRSIDLAHLLAFCTTHVEVDGKPVPAWADLSGVYPTLGGRHLQIHCNFAHHAEGVVRRLGCAPDRASVAAAIAERDAFELEAELIEDGMIPAAIRSLDEWNAHPHAVATCDLPLVTVEQIGDADPLTAPRASPVDSALGGLRVLDCTRVLAGPVAGQMLAGFGADVLRLGAEHLPSVDVGVMSTGFGKRNAFADIRTGRGRDAMRGLLETADVWIDAYRPGAFDGHGFDIDRVAELRPGIVIIQISAFDWQGPWAARRGFDSIIQSTSGVRFAGGEFAVNDVGASLGADPIGLPVQALDYATGFLAAGVASQLVQHQRTIGGSWLARLSLLRTRNGLCALGGPRTFVPKPVAVDRRFLATIDSDFGRLTAVTPFAGAWRTAAQRLGSSDPIWAS